MTKRKLISFFTIVKIGLIVFLYGQSCIMLTAQNLVPNASFEDINDCDFGYNDLPIGWSSATNGTPDMYNTCSVDPNFRVPNVLSCEFQNARTGNSYAGLIVYGNYTREYIQIELTETLKKGQWYFVEFFVAPIAGCNNWRYTDGIGLLFSNNLLSYQLPSGGVPIVLDPHIDNNNGVIDDVGNWTSISGCYQANGDENVIVIGNFKRNDETTLQAEFPNSVIQNYFFIDDVSVTGFEPLPDTVLLCEDEVTLTGNFLDTTFLWSTGDQSQSITVQEGGEYTAQVNIEGCIFKDTTVVFDIRTIQNFNNIDTICSDEILTLVPSIPGDYLWSDGSQFSFLNVRESGMYTATVTNECDTYIFDYDITSQSCDCQVFVPNVFTPNDDGNNDDLAFFVRCNFDYQFHRFSVFDRWGNRIFTTENENERWMGSYLEKPLSEGVYLWVLEFETYEPSGVKQRVESSDITLIRY